MGERTREVERNWTTNMQLFSISFVAQMNELKTEKKSNKSTNDDCMQNIIHRPNTQTETTTDVFFSFAISISCLLTFQYFSLFLVVIIECTLFYSCSIHILMPSLYSLIVAVVV